MLHPPAIGRGLANLSHGRGAWVWRGSRHMRNQMQGTHVVSPRLLLQAAGEYLFFCCANGAKLKTRTFQVTRFVFLEWERTAVRVSSGLRVASYDSYLVDPASSHMLVSKIKPCMSKYKHLYSETADGSLKQLWFIWWFPTTWIPVENPELIHANWGDVTKPRIY